MEEVKIKGVEILNQAEKDSLNQIIEKYKEKIKWKTKSDFILKLVIKEYSHDSSDLSTKRKKYSIKADVTGQSQKFESNAEDWEFNTAVRKAFDKLIQEIEHKYHSSEQRNSGKK